MLQARVDDRSRFSTIVCWQDALPVTTIAGCHNFALRDSTFYSLWSILHDRLDLCSEKNELRCGRDEDRQLRRAEG